MAAINAPGRTVRIAGKPHKVVFTINRLIAVEERYETIENASAAMQEHPLTAVRFMLWVGTGKPAPTEEEFGDLDIDDGISDAIVKVGAAFQESVGGEAPGPVSENGSGPTKLETAAAIGPSS